ncbi:hypothetical protein NA78x_002339 [Anatilimnocola sp. NA78]|uniref:hypothetical protein n=1 Tax=Anatilimnocola sp. NA78 TaxID=3415683 RepID=UPI003CE44DCF
MTHSAFEIRHGEFHDVIGPVRCWSEIAFVPARVTLHGSSFSSVFPLNEFTAGVSPATKALIRPGEDAPWVLGRLIRLFLTERIPEDQRSEKSCFFACFVAVMHQRGNLAIPFEVSDYYGRTSLMFSSEDAPSQELQAEIATAFWSLLMSEPAELEDYEDRMDHVGAGVWIRFGVENGEPFMFEDSDGFGDE